MTRKNPCYSKILFQDKWRKTKGWQNKPSHVHHEHGWLTQMVVTNAMHGGRGTVFIVSWTLHNSVAKMPIVTHAAITLTHLTALCPGLPGSAGTRKVKPIWILLKQETVSGSGISWAICKSAPRSRQIIMPAPHHSSFLQAGCPSCHPTNSVKALKANVASEKHINPVSSFWINSTVFLAGLSLNVCVLPPYERNHYTSVLYDTIRYDTRCYFNLRSKADISQLNLPHGTDN